MRASHSKPCLHHEAATCRRSRPPMSLPHSSRHGVLGAGAIHASLAGLGTPRACKRRPCLGFFTYSPPLTHAIRRTYVQFLVLVLSPSCDRLGRSYAAGPRTVCVTNLPNLNEGGPSEVRGITTRIACVYKRPLVGPCAHPFHVARSNSNSKLYKRQLEQVGHRQTWIVTVCLEWKQ